MEIISKSEKETSDAGKALAMRLKSGDTVALYGGLGAGKTAFVRGIAEGLGVQGDVTSPTFTIVNEYSGKIPLFHFDMYRLSSADELYDIGWEDYQERGGVCAVEWSENVASAIDGTAIKVIITPIGENLRLIDIKE